MNGSSTHSKKSFSLRDFTRLAIAFFCTLAVLGLYQQLRLYAQGVLDQVIGKSLMLLIVHHLGFAALAVLPLAFLFKALERRKLSLGFKWTLLLMLLLLLLEGILVEYYVTHFDVLGYGFAEIYMHRTSFAEFILALTVLLPISLGSFYLFYRISSGTYKIIGRMYPFTVVLFSLFLATQYSNKKPINENKIQHLLVDVTTNWLDMNPYEGEVEYPLLTDFRPDPGLASHFNLGETPPNLVLIIIDGLGSEFVGPRAAYRHFTPYLNSLRKESLFWPNHLSNTAESHASLPSILGSLPFGKSGFNRAEGQVNRNTLFGILKKNGYRTAFNYGGNTALNQWDKFLFDDRIDQLLDVKGFGTGYEKQKEDAAGISLGYPDGELYRKWYSDQSDTDVPFVEVFFTLSSKKPFMIPGAGRYEEQVKSLSEQEDFGRIVSKNIRKNKEAFASMLYADQELKGFMDRYRNLPYYRNTIFVITGSHMLSELPRLNPLSRYQVPLLVYSPMLKKAGVNQNLVSHMDITPSLIGLLSANYSMELPGKTSFLGNSLVPESQTKHNRQIPLFRHKSGIRDFIVDNYLLSDGYVYEIGADLGLGDADNDSVESRVKSLFKEFKAINNYVLRQNKLIPKDEVLYAQSARIPTKQEMVWINSVFNGTDYDNAYETARSLALKGERKRALILCSYILSEVPGHADTEILMGRIHAWEGNYELAIEILETAVLKYPVYSDVYSALLDVYFWSGRKGKVEVLERKLRRNRLYSEDLKNKVNRVRSVEMSADSLSVGNKGNHGQDWKQTAAIKLEE